MLTTQKINPKQHFTKPPPRYSEATLIKALGGLDRVRRVVKVLGAVNGTPDFTAQPAVVNGFSELMVEVFGPEAGVAARSAIGAPSLPLGVPVEIEAVFEIEP